MLSVMVCLLITQKKNKGLQNKLQDKVLYSSGFSTEVLAELGPAISLRKLKITKMLLFPHIHDMGCTKGALVTSNKINNK